MAVAEQHDTRHVAGGELAARDLNWKMRHTLAEMVSSQWDATRRAVEPSVGD